MARAIGVSRIKVTADSLEFDVVAKPSPLAAADPEAEKAAANKAERDKLREQLDTEWGHVGGCPYDDAMLDRILRGEITPR